MSENSYTPEYKIEVTGNQKLEHSFIPLEQKTQRLILIDAETDIQLNRLALLGGLHLQELYRRIIWNALYFQGIDVKNLPVKPKG